MKAQLRNHVAAAFLLAPVALTFSALPATVAAQQALEVRSLEVQSDAGLAPGSRLRFRMEGTPRAQASVRIRGVQSSIALREIERGLYVGRYVVTRADRIEPGAPIRAALRNGNRTATAQYTVPNDIAGVAVAPQPQPQPQPVPQELRITRFIAQPVDSAEPGTVLSFQVEGAPGATMAYVDLPGIDQNARLREVRPGVYEGQYTLRRDDRLNLNGRVEANLRWGDRVATLNLDRPLVAATSLPLEITSHANNGVVDGDTVHVRGRTAPFARVDVRVMAAPPLVGQMFGPQQVFAESIQANDRGFFEFSFRSPVNVAGTKYDVNLVARKADMHTETRLVLFQRQA